MKINEGQFNKQVADNITMFRKEAGLTQQGLADAISFSDKSVSKWERGESVPDAWTLLRLAEFFKTDINNLISENPKVKKEIALVVKKKTYLNLIVCSSIFMVSIIVYMSLLFLADINFWQIFVYTVSACLLASFICTSAHKHPVAGSIVLGLFVLSIGVSLHVTLLEIANIWLIYILSCAGVIMAVFSLLFTINRLKIKNKSKKERNTHGKTTA